MDTPDNYYATLGVPIDADSDTIKRAYRQLARRYHPDLAGEEGALQMKRVNRAYDVLSDPEKRLNYDTVIGGVIDLRRGGIVRPRPVRRKLEDIDDLEFSGLSFFSTRGPFHTGPKLRSQLGVISALNGAQTDDRLLVAAGSLDGKGLIWQAGSDHIPVSFATDSAFAIESLREMRLSGRGNMVAGWGRLGLRVWDAHGGALLWSYALGQRAVSAHFSLDLVMPETPGAEQAVWLALPLLREDPRAPRSQSVRGTGILKHTIGAGPDEPELSEPIVCAEDEIEKRQFWAIRLRALAPDARALLTLSCAHVPGEQKEMLIIRRWDILAHAKSRFRARVQPRITGSLIAGLCAGCTPPYATTPETRTLAFVYAGETIRLYDTLAGTFSELPCGTMGASSRLAVSPGAHWVAVAREDSEINEGVIDLWSARDGRIAQKLYHPWQISALRFVQEQLLVALTDGTIQIWQT